MDIVDPSFEHGRLNHDERRRVESAVRNGYLTCPGALVRPPGPSDPCFLQLSVENVFRGLIERSVDPDLFSQCLFDQAHVLATNVERFSIDMLRLYSFEAMDHVDQVALEIGT